MNNHDQNPAASLQHISRPSVAAQNAAPIEHPSAVALRMKNLDTHHCITIRWSLDSASRRQVGGPPEAAIGVAVLAVAGVGERSC